MRSVLSLFATSLLLVTACQFHASGSLPSFSASSSSSSGSSSAAGATPASRGDANGSTTSRGAANLPAPVIKSPPSGGTMVVGRPNVVQVDTTDIVTCTLYRNGEELVSAGSQPDKPCELNLSVDWLGDAELVVRAGGPSRETGATARETREKVKVVVAQPQPGPTPKWNGHYKFDAFDEGGGWFFSDDLTLNDGTLSLKLKAYDDQAADPEHTIFSFAPVQVKVDPDGTIVPQQVSLVVTKKPALASPSATTYLATARSVWIWGGGSIIDQNAHGLILAFQGPTAKGQPEDVVWSNIAGYFRDDVDVAALRESLRPPPRASHGSRGHGGSHGSGGGAAACKKACFHAEATCSGNRGACLKTRQACVSGCR